MKVHIDNQKGFMSSFTAGFRKDVEQCRMRLLNLVPWSWWEEW